MKPIIALLLSIVVSTAPAYLIHKGSSKDVLNIQIAFTIPLKTTKNGKKRK